MRARGVRSEHDFSGRAAAPCAGPVHVDIARAVVCEQIGPEGALWEWATGARGAVLLRKHFACDLPGKVAITHLQVACIEQPGVAFA